MLVLHNDLDKSEFETGRIIDMQRSVVSFREITRKLNINTSSVTRTWKSYAKQVLVVLKLSKAARNAICEFLLYQIEIKRFGEFVMLSLQLHDV
jgi:hypothetical protein